MPSNSVLEQKKAIVADLVEKLKKAQSGVIVQYQGITVEDDTKMRAAFRKAGVDYMVIKNTLIGRACDEVGYGAMKDKLNGMSAIAVSYEDPVAPAKIAKEYADKVETFEIKCGFIDNEVVDANAVKELVIGAKDTDSIVTGRYTGHPCRNVKTKFSKRLASGETNGTITPDEFEQISLGSLRKAVQDGNLDEGSFLCGAIAGMVKKVQPAKEIVEEMFAEAEKLLNR